VSLIHFPHKHEKNEKSFVFLVSKVKLHGGCNYSIADEEKEQEMQIGFPTDVKHVAHIGSDGPTNTTPSWVRSYVHLYVFSYMSHVSVLIIVFLWDKNCR